MNQSLSPSVAGSRLSRMKLRHCSRVSKRTSTANPIPRSNRYGYQGNIGSASSSPSSTAFSGTHSGTALSPRGEVVARTGQWGAQDTLRPASLPLEHFPQVQEQRKGDRKSTRLNSSHVKISYAVF